mmetsp:Transcript_28340/g.65710  ORF Transcript_28340/g.65710 Transcript_28340/m.65710 type:complete len:111 (-) Transcript_28340:679-1011(-)
MASLWPLVFVTAPVVLLRIFCSEDYGHSNQDQFKRITHTGSISQELDSDDSMELEKSKNNNPKNTATETSVSDNKPPLTVRPIKIQGGPWFTARYRFIATGGMYHDRPMQ